MPSTRRQKIPRIDLEDYRSGDASARRGAVADGGDALRVIGALRLLGHGVSAGPDESRGASVAASSRQDALRDVAAVVLRLLADYFGLPEDGFSRRMGEHGWSRVSPRDGLEEPVPPLLVLVPGPESSPLEVEGREGPRALSGAREGELVAIPGSSLSRLTDGVMPEVSLRSESEEVDADLFVVSPDPGLDLAPMEEFLEE